MESKESNRIPRSEFENNQHHSKTHNSIKLFRNNYIDLCHIVIHIYSLFGPWLILEGYTKAIEGFRTQFQQSYFSLVVHCIWLASKDYLPTKLQIDRALPWRWTVVSLVALFPMFPTLSLNYQMQTGGWQNLPRFEQPDAKLLDLITIPPIPKDEHISAVERQDKKYELSGTA